jgi:exosome complex component RRP42
MSNQRQASSASQVPHISPAELSYLYTSLSLPKTPIRPDGRSPTQFRPLTAETNILPGTNGSARIGFADGTQAIVGVKAEVEKTVLSNEMLARNDGGAGHEYGDQEGSAAAVGGHGSWVQMSIEIPGFRDDDALPVFLSEMMRESLVGAVGTDETSDMTGGLKGRLVINKRWHWRLYIDVCLRRLFEYGFQLISANSGTTGPSSLATSRIPSSSALADDTSCPFVYEVA